VALIFRAQQRARPLAAEPVMLAWSELLALLLATASILFADTQIAQIFSGDFVIKVNYSYLLSKPEGYEADTAKKWPLVIFLHGSGERGSDLEQLKKHGPPKAHRRRTEIPRCHRQPAM
jgi:predicted peptidase